MRIISATARIAFGLVCLSFSVWMAAFTLGMFPDRQAAVVEGRAALSENVAMYCTLLASRNDRRTIAFSLDGLVQRNDDVLSAAIRQPNGMLLHVVGPHDDHWDLPPGAHSTITQMRVPILAGDTEWGAVELRFRAQTASGLFSSHPLFRLLVFILAATALMFFIYLQKMLRHLDPSRVIPQRVRRTLDTLAEGLLVLDKDQRILLANRAFADNLGTTSDELTGTKASDLPFEMKGPRLNRLPWERANEEGEAQLGELITLRDKQNKTHVMRVNAAPVFGDDGKQRGVLASFDDVTQVEQSRVELRQMLGSISASRDEIRRQNLELEQLASQDPLTSCLNRRAFFNEMEKHWATANKDDLPLACVMIDLDNFKLINDTHGHATGDMVLKTAAALIRGGQRGGDLVCRYGGEEFCVALPKCDLDAACNVAEKIRAKLEATDIDGIVVTASIGVSARCLGSDSPEGMIDQADKCLYVAKRGGRNQVVRYDEAREAIAESEAAAPTPKPVERPQVKKTDESEEPMRSFFDTEPTDQATDESNVCNDVDTEINDIVSELAALGNLAERLADALDEQDFDGVATLAHRLNRIAVNNDSTVIADVTSRLEEAARDDATGTELVKLTGELLELCTIAQQARLKENTTPNEKDNTCKVF